MNEFFRKIANKISRATGSPWAFILAVTLIFTWLCTGPIFGFSDTWQLVINSSTTVMTFMMVFLIQNTQNRDSRAIHLKLDELIKSSSGARNKLINIEAMPDEDLEKYQKEHEKLTVKYDEELAKRRKKYRQAMKK